MIIKPEERPVVDADDIVGDVGPTVSPFGDAELRILEVAELAVDSGRRTGGPIDSCHLKSPDLEFWPATAGRAADRAGSAAELAAT